MAGGYFMWGYISHDKRISGRATRDTARMDSAVTLTLTDNVTGEVTVKSGLTERQAFKEWKQLTASKSARKNSKRRTA